MLPPQAYLRAARDTHPDKHVGDDGATERFQEVGRAYTVLSDPERRTLYDETGMVDECGGCVPVQGCCAPTRAAHHLQLTPSALHPAATARASGARCLSA